MIGLSPSERISAIGERQPAMDLCRICGSPETELLLDLGLQPVSSHFAVAPGKPAVRHPLALGVCRTCGVVQLARPFPYADLVPAFDWITYREPEGHLDAVASALRALPGLPVNARIAGLSFKDATTIERLHAHGLTRTWMLDAAQDLGAPSVGVESVQALLTPERAAKIVARRGPADVLIARHVLEHAEHPARFLKALGTLLAPGGYLMLEVPECGDNLARQDYAMIWEEHALYFTAQTLPQVFALAECSPISQNLYPYPFEDVIVAIGRKTSDGDVSRFLPEKKAVAAVVDSARAFGTHFATHTARYRQLLTEWTRDGQKVAAYGAGHLTCAFVNFHDLTDRFAFVVDDTLQKQGLFLPGCDLPVVPRSHLDTADVDICLFGLGPQTEDKIIAANTNFVRRGGKFYSMLVDSPRSISRSI